MPEDPLATMLSNFAQGLNQIAPHTVIPKMIASIVPKPAAEAVTQGAGYDGGVVQRRASREGNLEAMESRFAADREATLGAGTSMTGKTVFY